MHYKYLIIGSGIAGFFALKELSTLDPTSNTIMVTKDRYYPYDRPPLSKYYLVGQMAREKVFLEGEEFYERANLKVLLSTEVEKILPKERQAVLSNGKTISFERALIATGGDPRGFGRVKAFII
jgi:NADPH-dependent 2,4-dienoyl-CoA reductase/sulfur reductase-like enzyme